MDTGVYPLPVPWPHPCCLALHLLPSSYPLQKKNTLVLFMAGQLDSLIQLTACEIGYPANTDRYVGRNSSKLLLVALKHTSHLLRQARDRFGIIHFDNNRLVGTRILYIFL